MRFKDKLRFNSVSYFVLSIIIRWLYNVFAFFLPHSFTLLEKNILHILLALTSLVLGWLALQFFRKASPTGSNLGCFYLVLLIINLIGGVGALFFAMVRLFGDEGGAETLWLL